MPASCSLFFLVSFLQWETSSCRRGAERARTGQSRRSAAAPRRAGPFCRWSHSWQEQDRNGAAVQGPLASATPTPQLAPPASQRESLQRSGWPGPDVTSMVFCDSVFRVGARAPPRRRRMSAGSCVSPCCPGQGARDSPRPPRKRRTWRGRRQPTPITRKQQEERKLLSFHTRALSAGSPAPTCPRKAGDAGHAGGSGPAPHLQGGPVLDQQADLDVHEIEVLLELLIGPDLPNHFLLELQQLGLRQEVLLALI